MGGVGSGAWDRRHRKKATVEESLTLAVSDFRGRIHTGCSGAFTWRWAGGRQSRVRYDVAWPDRPIITLHYCRRDGTEVRIPVRLHTTPTHFGGERWWFTCPLILNGVACNRRVGKLHLPPGAWYFGCRICHRLTYQSCQAAHRTERLFSVVERLARQLAARKRRLR